MQFTLIVLHVGCGLHPTVQHFHEVASVSHVALLVVDGQQVLRDVLQVTLEYRPPLVSEAEFVETGLIERVQVNSPIRHRGMEGFLKLGFFCFVGRWDTRQVRSEDFLVREQ